MDLSSFRQSSETYISTTLFVQKKIFQPPYKRICFFSLIHIFGFYVFSWGFTPLTLTFWSPSLMKYFSSVKRKKKLILLLFYFPKILHVTLGLYQYTIVTCHKKIK